MEPGLLPYTGGRERLAKWNTLKNRGGGTLTPSLDYYAITDFLRRMRYAGKPDSKKRVNHVGKPVSGDLRESSVCPHNVQGLVKGLRQRLYF